RHPACVDDRSRRADGGAERVGEDLHGLLVPLGALAAASAGNDDARLGEVRPIALGLVEADELRLQSARVDAGVEALHLAARCTLGGRSELGGANADDLLVRRDLDPLIEI